MEEFKLSDWGESDGIGECMEIIREAGGSITGRGTITLYEGIEYSEQVYKAIDYLCNEWDYAMALIPQPKFRWPTSESQPVPCIVSYKGLGRRAVYPKQSWFGKLFSWFFGNDGIPKYIYKFEITVSVPEYLRMGHIASIDGVRWYIELKNGPNRYTIVNISAVDETIFHFEPETPVFGLYAAVAEGGS